MKHYSFLRQVCSCAENRGKKTISDFKDTEDVRAQGCVVIKGTQTQIFHRHARVLKTNVNTRDQHVLNAHKTLHNNKDYKPE